MGVGPACIAPTGFSEWELGYISHTWNSSLYMSCGMEAQDYQMHVKYWQLFFYIVNAVQSEQNSFAGKIQFSGYQFSTSGIETPSPEVF